MAGVQNIYFPDNYLPEDFWPDYYWPKSPAAVVEISEHCLDTVAILDEWKEQLDIYRMTKVYNENGLAVESWNFIESFQGDWQPAGGDTMRKEAKLQIKSSSIIIAPCNVMIEANDRIYRSDGTFEYINYVREYEDHITIYLKKSTG